MRAFHPIADLLPLMTGKDFDDLVADIRVHGLRTPIIIDGDGCILDGRNRARACAALNREPDHRLWDGEGTVQNFIVSMNLHRRHLTVKQRAFIAGRLVTAIHGGHGGSVNAQNKALTEQEAGKLLGVSRTVVQAARAVLRHGDPATIAAVEHGSGKLHSTADALRKGKDGKSSPSRGAAREAALLRLRDLAAQGYTSRQMSKTLKRGEDWCRKEMKVHGIACPGDRVAGRTRRLKPDDVMDRFVCAAENLTVGVELIDLDDIDPRRIRTWVDQLTAARQTLDTFIRQLARKAQTNGSSSKEDTEVSAGSQDLSGAHCADAHTHRTRHPA